MDGSNGNLFAHLGESAGEYRPPGDFYLEPDTVTRSVTFCRDDIAPLDSQFKGLSDGDYYQEPMGMHKACEPYPSSLETSDVGYSSITCDSLKTTATRRFTQADFPLEAPKDSFFQFEITTLFVITDMPHEIGNLLLDFLTDKVASSLVKPVNHRKFAFKADVFEQYIMATIKVRVYWKENKHFAIEFQRRRGDTLVFNSTFQNFQKAIRHATNIGLEVTLRNAQMTNSVNFAPPSLPQQQARELSEADLTPILDMAGQIGMDSIQAEAAAALAKLVEDDTVTLKICTTSVFQQVKTLLQNGTTEVAYPAARFAKYLVQQQEAAPLIVEHGILQLMLEKVQSKTTKDIVREELAQACSMAAHQSKETVPQVERKQLARSLSECTRQMEVAGDLAIAQSLRSAQMALSY
mmetsp:Transcript_85774/g.135473  ORF Transcript_85774/g.135473 Transcript_85774/m.135473 type:complete len:408 (-) Transcript_85774:155-1378(-)